MEHGFIVGGGGGTDHVCLAVASSVVVITVLFTYFNWSLCSLFVCY